MPRPRRRRSDLPARSGPPERWPEWRSLRPRQVDQYADLLVELDLLLVMTVEPGFGGQAFLDSMLTKIRQARQLVRGRGLDVRIQVDGGVGADTIAACAEAGADTFVAGSAVFGAEDAAAAVADLRRVADAATV